jgi:VanZ family protein
MKKNRFFIGTVIYFAFLSILSHIPGSAIDEISWDFWDKAVHFCAYLPIGLLLALGFAGRGLKDRRLAILLLVTAVVLGLGAIDELHQSFVPGRYATFLDIVADVIGGFSGAVVGLFVGTAVLRGNCLEDEKKPIQWPS